MKAPVSILLALLVFFASVGMAKTTHFCMGTEMTSALGFGAKHVDCGMEMPMSHDEQDSSNQKDPNSCCENVTEHLQVDDDVQLKKLDIQFQLNFAVALVQVFVFGMDQTDADQTDFSPYLTPPLDQNFQLLYQNFLI
jgi:hypothetical protein